MNQSICPEIIYVSEDAREDTLTKRVLSRYPDVPVCHLYDRGDPITELGFYRGKQGLTSLDSNEQFTLGKRELLLTRYLGNWLKACPGTSQHVCCNLWVVNPGEGCPLDCTYCYLQLYLRRNPTLKLYTNTNEMLAAIEKKAVENSSRVFRIGTGEIFDSLVWDEVTDLSFDLVPFFARIPNITLELKTKTNSISNLLLLKNEHKGKTVVSWSVNAKSITERDEASTNSLIERIEAAASVIDAGYRVGFHFDPVVFFPGWEDEYRDTIRAIFSNIDVNRIAWVSVSSIRYKKEMQEIMESRFPQSSLPFGEQFLAKDGKLRYIQPLRIKLLDFVWKELRSYKLDLPVYMCMESAAAWRHVAGGPPQAGSELVEIFSRKGRNSMSSSVEYLTDVSQIDEVVR